MDSDLLATCNALGFLEEDRYFKEPDCLDTVKCLIKYLHTEDNNHDIRTQLGSGNIVRNDLLPILRQYSDDDALCAAVLRLLVNLTQPALLCFGNKIPTEVDQYHSYLDILSHNQTYKEDFSNEETWKVLAQKVYDILEKDWEDRTPDDSMMVERILVLFRNVLHVPPTEDDEKQVSDSKSTHDELIVAMHNAGIDSMILYLASSTTEQQWCLHVAEIIALLLKEQSPGDLAGLDNHAERAREGDELSNMRQQEERRKKMRVLQQSSRHSRFGGTFVAKGMTALTDTNDLLIHKSIQKCNNITYDEGKQKFRKGKNRRPLVDTSVKRHTTREVQSILKEFCSSLLENGYNHLLFGIRDKISRKNAEEHDETYYFTIMSFMMEFNRKHKFHVDQVSETLQLATLHFIDVSIVNCMDLMITDKDRSKTWGKRMHLALRCYKEFLLTVQMMQTSQNEAFVESAKVLLNNIFYTSEYREIFLTLLRKYDDRKLSHTFLDDLIQTTHLFIRLFEKYCKGNSVVVEKKRKKKKKPKKKRNNQARDSESVVLTEEDRHKLWSEIVDLIAEAVQGADLPDPGPASDIFDPTSDVPEQEQQQKALVKLQCKIHSKLVLESVVFLRQARELWPEIDIFGSSDSTWEDDVSTLKGICLADMSGLPGEDPINGEEVEEEEEEEDVFVSSKEVEFSFNDFMRKFVDSKVIQGYVLLLTKFENNSQHTNHCIVKLLHRVSYDMKMYGILFQASVFRCFQKIFRCSKLDPSLKELASFGKYIVQKFFEVLPSNDKLFAEILFWKPSATHVYELTEGYGSFGKGQGSITVTWSEAERTELSQLYEEVKDGDLDIVECILARITDESRTRRQVVKQLLSQGLVDDPAQLKRKKSARIIWREQDEIELKTLFEEFRESEDPLGNIIQMMNTKRSKPKVTEKLLAMGLVQDRKELYKRRKKSDAPRRRKTAEPAIMHAGGASDSDEDVREEEAESESDDDSWELIDLQVCIKKATSRGLAEQISWVKTNLEQAIEDRNQTSHDDEDQSVPLVPLTEEQEDAMQNPAFRKMLHFIGLNKPSAGQEMFWRIPSNMTVARLEESVEVLSQPVQTRKPSPRQIERPEEVLDLVQAGEESSSSSTKRKRVLDSGDEDENDMGPQGDASISSDSKAKRQRRILALDDSDSDSENTNEETLHSMPILEHESPKMNKRRRLIVDDSDEDDVVDNENQDMDAADCQPEKSGPGSTESEATSPVKNRMPLAVMDGDDEDD